jgi:NAD(P)-dependent dehydrogenase (short-subunit alcohol dehydrogenase family)
VADGLKEFGHIDVVIPQHGVSLLGKSWEITEEEWQTIIDINLTAVWRVAKAAVPSMIEAQRGGSVIFTTSGAAARALGHMAHYASTKSGLIGLCREMALELGPYGIRVNTLQPTTVQTEMMDNESMAKLFTPDMEDAPLEERRARMIDIAKMAHMLPVAWVQPEDMADGALFLASDESRMVTGAALRIDAGFASH